MKVLANFEDNHKIPTNSGIDNLLDGGVEKGTVTQIFGPTGLCWQWIRNSEKRISFSE